MNSEEDVYKNFSYSNPTYTPAGVQSNMFTDLHIDPDNDIVYTQIIGRTLSDLYSNNRGSTSGGEVTFPDLSSADQGYQYQETDTDKFWLLSYYEAYTLLSGNATTSSDTDREWRGYFWLRSPSLSYSGNAYYVYTSGYLNDNYRVNNSGSAARAAFKFSI